MTPEELPNLYEGAVQVMRELESAENATLTTDEIRAKFTLIIYDYGCKAAIGAL